MLQYAYLGYDELNISVYFCVLTVLHDLLSCVVRRLYAHVKRWTVNNAKHVQNSVPYHNALSALSQ